MRPAATVFDLAGARAQMVGALTAAGYRFGVENPIRRTLLDSFDARLRSSGLRLVLVESDERKVLTLTGTDMVAATAEVAIVPQRTAELPAGSFRARVGAALGVRALVPRLYLSCTASHGHRFDTSNRTISVVTVSTDVQVQCPVVLHVDRPFIEVTELVGEVRSFEKALAVVSEHHLKELGTDLMSVVAEAAGVDLGDLSGAPTIALGSKQPAIDGFRAVLRNLLAAARANIDGASRNVDVEFLHDLRVAIRRTRSVLAEGRRVVPPDEVAWARERFGWLAGMAGPARDLDVMLVEWDGIIRPFDESTRESLAGVDALCQRRCDEAHDDLAQCLSSQETVDLLNRWQEWLDEPDEKIACGDHGNRALGDVVAARLTKAQTKLIDAGSRITAESPADELHDLRKKAKRLRYLFESFGALIADDERKRFVQRLKALQDNLGEHQDAQVQAERLTAIAAELRSDNATTETLLALGRVIERLDARRISARDEFATRFAAYDTDSTNDVFNAVVASVRS